MKREMNELAFRTKLIVGLSLLGGITGGLLYLHFFIFEQQLVELQQYAVAVWRAFTLDEPAGILRVRRELLYSAAAGAVALGGPVLLFLVKPRGGHHF